LALTLPSEAVGREEEREGRGFMVYNRLSKKKNGAFGRFVALGRIVVAIATEIGIGGLLAGAPIAGAVPAVVDIGAMVHLDTAAVENPYLIFKNATADGSKTVVVLRIGSEDIGKIDGGVDEDKGFGDGVGTEVVGKDERDEDGVGLVTAKIKETG